VARIEGKDNIDSEDKLSNAFAALMVDIDKEDQHLDTFFTLVKGLLTKPAVPYVETLVEELNNQALVH
jgi:hypothetical protein